MIVLIIILEVLAIAANLAMPLMEDASLRNRAHTIARDMERIRTASLEARAGKTSWSPSPQPDAAPPEVTAELPGDLVLEHPDCRLVWERWSVSDPASLGLRQRDVAAVTVVADEPRLAALVASALPAGEIRYTNGNRTTLVIDP